MYRTTFVAPRDRAADPLMNSFLEGGRNIAHWLTDELQRVCPERWLQMHDEVLRE